MESAGFNEGNDLLCMPLYTTTERREQEMHALHGTAKRRIVACKGTKL